MTIQFGKGLVLSYFVAGCSYAIVPEQKARTTYENILRLSDNPDVNQVMRFLRAREIVHYQRFGEAKREDRSKICGMRA